MDTALAVSSAEDARALWALGTSFYQHQELKDDRTLFFANYISPGAHVFGYFARVMTHGSYLNELTTC